MVTQLHLALVMAIDARLLVLDEPTLGLDLLFRKQFYDALLGDYLDRDRTVLLATHQVDEVEHVLTDLVFIDRGRIVFNHTMEEVEADYHEVLVRPDKIAEARALQPVHERDSLGRTVMLFAGTERGRLAPLGDVGTPAIADLFLAMIGAPQPAAAREGAAR
jgi:ABC-2 type transport system ATP-binding protein